MDLGSIPHYQHIPGRQDAIDHAGKIDKRSFLISYSVLFGIAELCVLVRFAIRIFGNVPLRFDDALVLLAALALASSYATCLHNLDALYLVEAMDAGLALPFLEELPKIIEIPKWSAITSALNWTSVYLVKMTFLYFFHTLVRGLPRRIMIFYWTAVAFTFVFWIYSTFTSIIICPHFGADSAKCSSLPNQHVRSLSNDILLAVSDIICDTLIVSLPLVVLSRSMMPLSRKISLAAMLCLSVVMIAIALIRLIGTIVNTKPDGHGSAPTWYTYWAAAEGCIALMTTTVIVIRAVFITKTLREHRRMDDSIWSRASRRLLSTLRLGGSSGGSGHTAPRECDEEHAHGPKAPHIATKALTRATLANAGNFVSSEGQRSISTEDILKQGGSSYQLDDIGYYTLRGVDSGAPNPPR